MVTTVRRSSSIDLRLSLWYVAGMTRPEQELLAKYLLQQLKSDSPDPILARLDLSGEQSQTIATIVPAPPGLDTIGDVKQNKCKFSHILKL